MSQTTTQTGISYDEAVKEFVTYLKEYRSFSALTVRAYGTDMRMLRQFLEERLERVPSPVEITREMIVQSLIAPATRSA